MGNGSIRRIYGSLSWNHPSRSTAGSRMVLLHRQIMVQGSDQAAVVKEHHPK